MTPTHTELGYLTMREAGQLLKRRELSPVELTRTFLDRIEALDSKLQAYITVLPQRAMAAARTAEAEMLRGDYRGPLHGIPIALKDLYDTKGIRTTASSRVMADRVRNLAHIPGGSSSGSGAAVAAGLCMGSLGSCTGGSIRGPAAYCSMVGLKPTYGRVSRYGVVPLSWSLDHCGPMTWTVEDTASMLQAIAGPDPKDPTSSRAPVPDYSAALKEDIKGLTIGVPRHFFWADDPRIDRETLALVDAALQTLTELGAQVEEVTIPTLHYAGAAQPAIMLSEAFAYHQRLLRSQPEEFGDMVRARFRIGGLLSSADYVQAQRVRNVLKREFAAVLQKVDVIVSPTMSSTAPTFATVDGMTTARRPSFTGPYNLTGMPAISVPCGFTTAGLPVGLQIAGKPFDEPTVLRMAYAYQQHARWFEKRPPM